MMSKRFWFSLICFLLIGASAAYSKEKTAPESDQQINEFSLSGYGDKGKKSWDLSGKSADIFDQVVKLKDVIGNLYGKEENIKLTAEKGDFNKTDGKVHLEDNVIITTSSGARLTTDSLDWDRKSQLVSTDALVNIEKDNLKVVAEGAKGDSNLKKVALGKNVRLDINPEAAEAGKKAVKDKTVITCDGPLEIDYANNIATFFNNVKVERPDSVIYSDKMDVYFIPSKKETKEADKSGVGPDFMGSKIDKIVARGNVKVVRGENTSFSQEAVYSAADQKLTLSGRPQLVIYSQEDLSASFGN